MSSPRREPQIVEVVQCVPRPNRRWRPIPSSYFIPATEELTETELLERNQVAEQLRNEPTRKRKRSADRGIRHYVLASTAKAGDTERRAILAGGRRGVTWETIPLPPTPQKTLQTRRANLPQIMGGSPKTSRIDGEPSQSSVLSPQIDAVVDAGFAETEPTVDLTAEQERTAQEKTTEPTKHQMVSHICIYYCL